MIVSHKHKYIFVKAGKVAGSSIEAALVKHCGEEDIVPPTNEFSSYFDDTYYEQKASKHYEGFKVHMKVKDIQDKVGPKVWKEYFTFSIVRNPWDLVVSKFFYHHANETRPVHTMMTKKRILKYLFTPRAYVEFVRRAFSFLKPKKPIKKEFEDYVMKLTSKDFTEYYFNEDGTLACDFYMRYEHLKEDYAKLCKKIGIPVDEIPRLKTKSRKDKQHYSVYYNEKSKQKVKELFAREIKHFHYTFAKK